MSDRPPLDQLSIQEKNLRFGELESQFATYQLSYQGISVWPILKAYAFLDDDWGAKFEANQSLLAKLRQTLGILFLLLKSSLNSLRTAYREMVTKGKPPDLLLFVQHKERHETIKGKAFSRFLSGIPDLLAGQHELTTLTVDALPLYQQPKGLVYGQQDRLYKSLHHTNLLARLRWLWSGHQEKINGYREWIANQKNAGYPVKDWAGTPYAVYRAFALAAPLKAYLKKTQPKAIVYSCYYSTLSFALAIAATRLGIKTIEIQHGQQGKYHPMYADWQNFPNEKPMTVLPDIIWTWGSASSDRIAGWLGSNPYHQIKMGGNPWLAWIRKFGLELPVGDQLAYEVAVESYSKIVLVSVQFLDDFVNGIVPAAMQAAPNDYLWLLRLHPRFPDSDGLIVQKLDELGISNYKLGLAGQLPLYWLLPRVDVHLTGWSTVAYEADLFEVPTILTHPNGKDAMSTYLQEGVFAYAANSQQLTELLTSSVFRPKRPQKPYILGDEQVIINSFIELLAN